MFSNKAVADAGLSGKPMSKTFAPIENPYSSSPLWPHYLPPSQSSSSLTRSQDDLWRTQEFEMPALSSLFVPRLMFLKTCLTCTIKYILIWLQTFLTLEISSIYPPHVPIYTYFNKGCLGNRALVFESHCLVVTQAKHCIVFCVSLWPNPKATFIEIGVYSLACSCTGNSAEHHVAFTSS